MAVSKTANVETKETFEKEDTLDDNTSLLSRESRRVTKAVADMNGILKDNIYKRFGSYIISYKDVEDIMTVGTMLEDNLLLALAYIIKRRTKDTFCGWLPPVDIQQCPEESPEISTIKARIAAGCVCVQPMFDGKDHFVAVVVNSPQNVTVFDSVGKGISAHLKLEIWNMFGNGQEELVVEVPSVHKQEEGSNSCLAYSAAFCIEAMAGRDVRSAVFDSDWEMRSWLYAMFDQDRLLKPPKYQKLEEVLAQRRTQPPVFMFKLTQDVTEKIRTELTRSGRIPSFNKMPASTRKAIKFRRLIKRVIREVEV